MAKKNQELILSFNFWRYLINIWSVVFFVVIIYDFLTGNSCTEFLDVVAMLYIGLLTIYVSDKEFKRWYHNHNRQHPGERFVIAWTVLIVFLIIANLIVKIPYHLPASVVSSYIAVLTLLAITRKSKQTYQIHHRKKIDQKK
jgi:uncharacterized protein YacL